MGIPVVISANNIGMPVRPVDKNAPLMTVATNGRGIPIVISDRGAPFVVQGYNPAPFSALSFLSTDNDEPLVDDGEDAYIDTYDTV